MSLHVLKSLVKIQKALHGISLRPRKNCLFALPVTKKVGSVGRDFFITFETLMKLIFLLNVSK